MELKLQTLSLALAPPLPPPPQCPGKDPCNVLTGSCAFLKRAIVTQFLLVFLEEALPGFISFKLYNPKSDHGHVPYFG